MSEDKSNLNTGEAKAGRFVLRLGLVVAWAFAAWIVYFNAEQFEVSDTMRILLAGFASLMAVISFIQALGNYGPEKSLDKLDENQQDDETEKK